MEVIVNNIKIDNIDCSTASSIHYEQIDTYMVDYIIILDHQNKLSGSIVCHNPNDISISRIKEAIRNQFKEQ